MAIQQHKTIPTRLKYQLALGALLVFATFVSLTFEKLQARISGNDNYSFLVFNLVLAWIPLIAALLAYVTRRFRWAIYLVMPVSVLVWLVFFPNAPYLLTDFQHLVDRSGYAPLWFDVIMLIWFAWTGLLLGITSLYLMQEIISDLFSPLVGWLFAIGVTTFSSLGVYLGRFLRWNSWDLLYDPVPIAKDMVAIVRHPLANLPTYVFTILFTLLFLFIYLTIHLFAGMIRAADQRG